MSGTWFYCAPNEDNYLQNGRMELCERNQGFTLNFAKTALDISNDVGWWRSRDHSRDLGLDVHPAGQKTWESSWRSAVFSRFLTLPDTGLWRGETSADSTSFRGWCSGNGAGIVFSYFEPRIVQYREWRNRLSRPWIASSNGPPNSSTIRSRFGIDECIGDDAANQNHYGREARFTDTYPGIGPGMSMSALP